jgi:hypothetical protein
MGSCVSDPITVESGIVKPDQVKVELGVVEEFRIKTHSIRNEFELTTLGRDPQFLEMLEKEEKMDQKAIASFVISSHFRPLYDQMITYWNVFNLMYEEILDENFPMEQLTKHKHAVRTFSDRMRQFFYDLTRCDYLNPETKLIFTSRILSNIKHFHEMVACGFKELKSIQHECRC